MPKEHCVGRLDWLGLICCCAAARGLQGVEERSTQCLELMQGDLPLENQRLMKQGTPSFEILVHSRQNLEREFFFVNRNPIAVVA